MLDFLIEKFPYYCILPVLFFVGYFFYCRYLFYPKFLKKQMILGKSWIYVPEKWKRISYSFSVSLGFFLLLSFSVSTALLFICYIIQLFNSDKYFIALCFLPLFFILSFFLYKIAVLQIYKLEQDTHFFIYRKTVYEEQLKGKSIVHKDIESRTNWKFHKILMKAEFHGRFLKYLKAASKTKKIPKDLYAEALL